MLSPVIALIHGSNAAKDLAQSALPDARVTNELAHRVRRAERRVA
jgi:hypothetical protein